MVLMKHFFVLFQSLKIGLMDLFKSLTPSKSNSNSDAKDQNKNTERRAFQSILHLILCTNTTLCRKYGYFTN